MVVDAKATGENIKALMDKNNLTVTDVRKACCLATSQAVYKWIWGVNLPTLDNLIVLAKLFNCKMDDIIIRDVAQFG